MNKIFYTLFSFFFYSLILQGQPFNDDQALKNFSSNNAYLIGKVIDATTKIPLEYATISILNKADDTLVDGNITNENGVFKLEIKPGNYYVSIEFLAYEKQVIEKINVKKNDKNIDLGTIQLLPKTSELEEVTVVAEKSEMIVTLDKKVFMVGKDLVARGGNSLDLLGNIPSVQVDAEGNVSLRGNGSVKILVDGKPSILVNSANGLRTLQANMIDRVEVITNPSARYEGEGSAGILNIILKKDQTKGLNGSFDFTLGYPRNDAFGFNLNYRTQKLNFFSNYGISYQENPTEGSKFQELYRNDSTFITSQNSLEESKNLAHSLRFGADYFFNQTNTLTTACAYRRSNNHYFVTTTYEDYIATLTSPSITQRMVEEQEKEIDLEYSLTYKKTFPEKDRKLTVDLRYQDEFSKSQADFMNRFYDSNFKPTGLLDVVQRSDNKKNTGQFILQADYVYPFSKDHKFEIGLRSSTRTIDNDYRIEELTDGYWLALEDFTNHFKYGENISATYLQYAKKINQFSYSAGFRMEYSRISTQLSETDSIRRRDYFNPIPTLHLTYELSDNQSIQWSYSRRLRRPPFWDLNPFYSYLDDRNLFRGNPELDPELTDAFELGHLQRWSKGSLNSAIYYRHTTEAIERIRSASEEGVFTNQPKNLNTKNIYGIELIATYSPFSWWRLNSDLNFYQAVIDGTNIPENVTSKATSFLINSSSKLTLKKKANIQIRYHFRGPSNIPQGKYFAIHFIDLSVDTKILKGKGNLTLSARDIFNSNRYRYLSEGINFYTESIQQWRSRNVTLSLNYRLH